MVTQSVFCNCCFSNKTVLLSEICHFLLSLSQGFLNSKHTKEKKKEKNLLSSTNSVSASGCFFADTILPTRKSIWWTSGSAAVGLPEYKEKKYKTTINNYCSHQFSLSNTQYQIEARGKKAKGKLSLFAAQLDKVHE